MTSLPRARPSSSVLFSGMGPRSGDLLSLLRLFAELILLSALLEQLLLGSFSSYRAEQRCARSASSTSGRAQGASSARAIGGTTDGEEGRARLASTSLSGAEVLACAVHLHRSTVGVGLPRGRGATSAALLAVQRMG